MKTTITLPSLPLLLAIIFMVLKLCGVIAWSWFWVVSPIILPILLFVGFFLLWLCFAIIYHLCDEIYRIIKNKIKNKK